MGDLIPFGRGKKVNLSSRNSEPSGGFESPSFFTAFEKALESQGIEVDVGLRIKAHLASLRGTISSQAIAIAEQQLADSSIEELRRIAKNSTSLQWSARPAYFTVLAEKICF